MGLFCLYGLCNFQMHFVLETDCYTQHYSSLPVLFWYHQELETKNLHFPDSHASGILVLIPPIRDSPMRFGKEKRKQKLLLMPRHWQAGKWFQQVQTVGVCSGFHVSLCESSCQCFRQLRSLMVGDFLVIFICKALSL